MSVTKTWSITSYIAKDVSLSGYTTLENVVTQMYYKCSATDGSSTVEITGSIAYDPYHLIKNTADPRTGNTTTFIPFASLTDANMVTWITNLYDNDVSMKTCVDYEINYLLTGEDPNSCYT